MLARHAASDGVEIKTRILRGFQRTAQVFPQEGRHLDPPSSTSSTTVPPAGSFSGDEFSDDEVADAGTELAAFVVEAFPGCQPTLAVNAAVTTCPLIGALATTGVTGVSLASAKSRLAPR